MKTHAIIFIFTLLMMGQGGVVAQNLDINTLEKINGIEATRGFSRVVSNTSSYFEVGIPLTIAGVALIEGDDALLKKGIYIGASFGVNLAATYAIKQIVRRPRPRANYPDRIVWYEDMTTNSFPSGHTSAAFNTATSLTLSFPKWYVAAPSFLWASSVGYSRMNLGVHYPSDVLCGAVLGSVSAFLTWKVNYWFWKKQNNKRLIGKDLETVWY